MFFTIENKIKKKFLVARPLTLPLSGRATQNYFFVASLIWCIVLYLRKVSPQNIKNVSCMKWVKTSWTNSTYPKFHKNNRKIFFYTICLYIKTQWRCNVIFWSSGFAYVGYAVVRQTFGRKWDRPGITLVQSSNLTFIYKKNLIHQT